MYRGTTPTFTFDLPIEADTITAASVVFRQAGSVDIEKSLADCAADGQTLTVSLTEEETLSLRSGTVTPLEIQLRIGVGDVRMASQIFTVPVERILKDGAL